MPKETLDILKADDTLTRWYTAPEGGANLFVAFFKTQRQGQSPHSPKNCLPGTGWQPSETGRIDVPIEGAAGGSIHINQYVVAKGAAQDVVLYWYQTQGRVIASEYSAKFWMVSDALTRNRTDGALVRVITPMNDGEEAAKARLTQFTQALFPHLQGILPN